MVMIALSALRGLPWRWIAVAAVMLTRGFAIYHAGDRHGTLHERAVWNARVKAEGKANAKTTDKLATVAGDAGTKVVQQQVERDKIVVQYRDRIVSAPVSDVPDCAVSDAVADDLNAIKAAR